MNSDSKKHTEFSKTRENESKDETFQEEETLSSQRNSDEHNNDHEHIRITDDISPEIQELLNTDPKTGLSTEVAQSRLEKFGKNEIEESKTHPFLKFLSYFRGSIAYLIELACIVAAIVQDWVDFGIILALLFVNASIGFIEESRAESALDALKQTLALKTRVRRDGKFVELNTADLVPGDIIALRLGDIVPADAKLLGIGVNGSKTEEKLLVDQSALTGESLPLRCQKDDSVYSSSTVKQGQVLAIVFKTGADTYIGRTASLMNMTVEQGHFQKVINKIGNFLIWITAILVTIIFVYQVVKFRGTPQGDVLRVLQHILVLTVGLPTVLSVTMAVGAKQLAAKKVIVKRLTSIEELASVSVLCSDKTGTMTLNELTFDEPWLASGFTKSDILLYSYLCSETITSFIPFNPSKKSSQATVVKLETNESFQIAKGAPQVIIKLAGGNEEASQAVNDLAKRGLRALGIAKTDSNDKNRWKLIGFISLLDPPRPDTKDTIEKCKNLGVKVKMITGDQVIIAKEVAHRLGMGRVILDANYLVDPTKSLQEITEHCERADGFAQVTPEHKFKVVEFLQKKGYLVAMTGDGVNDAPALKKANVGIAVQGCTDAARSAADIVLLAPGLSTIVDGIYTSRAIFQRMRSYALYRITSTIHFLLFFFIVILAFNWTLPAVLLILIAILNDAATIVISVDNAQISERPDKWRLGQLIFLSIILGIFLTGFSFAHFFIFRDVIGVAPEQLHTVMYLHISSAPHFLIFATRIPGHFWENLPSLLFVTSIIGTQLFALLISVFGWLSSSINLLMAVIILLVSLGIFIFLDFIKVLIFKHWSFELTARLWPTSKQRKKLAVRKSQREKNKKVSENFSKLKKVLIMTRVIRRFRAASDEKENTESSNFNNDQDNNDGDRNSV
ncbi:16253_t:CDS:10 [Funneliformis geosporum]|uniref:P-type H(+)-exporting transporter n=1 Tax=Funneliformis geosporum TaxID=1117311 RepID=A0A9W4WNF7_9GLOM|nr:16253_t:CDS:10 [Funneliformis geosporum]CAI2174614.1 6175_t:CDS:10 [Funneliformis geosporum]